MDIVNQAQIRRILERLDRMEKRVETLLAFINDLAPKNVKYDFTDRKEGGV